ncbi:MAG: hypothetical protein AB8I08_26480 [Sandaracinaceae bacterium]
MPPRIPARALPPRPPAAPVQTRAARMVRSAVDTLTGFPVSKAILAPRGSSSYEPAPFTAPYPFGPATAEVDVRSFLALPGWMEGPHRYWRTSRPAERIAVAAVVLLGLVVGSAAGFVSLLSTPDVSRVAMPAAKDIEITPVASPRQETLALAMPASVTATVEPTRLQNPTPDASTDLDLAELPAAAPVPEARPSRREIRRARARRARRRALRRARRARRGR